MVCKSALTFLQAFDIIVFEFLVKIWGFPSLRAFLIPL